MTGEEILSEWLRGCTCTVWRKKPIRRILLENDTHIVLKHESHAEYINRFDGNSTCAAYAVLYLKSDIEANPDGLWAGLGLDKIPVLKRWCGGRIAASRVRNDCAADGIIFG